MPREWKIAVKYVCMFPTPYASPQYQPIHTRGWSPWLPVSLLFISCWFNFLATVNHLARGHSTTGGRVPKVVTPRQTVDELRLPEQPLAAAKGQWQKRVKLHTHTHARARALVQNQCILLHLISVPCRMSSAMVWMAMTAHGAKSPVSYGLVRFLFISLFWFRYTLAPSFLGRCLWKVVRWFRRLSMIINRLLVSGDFWWLLTDFRCR